MSTKSPIFPLPEPQHFSDYGFDPQIDYFQVLEEARKHTSRSIDSLHFKLQKPISKDDDNPIHINTHKSKPQKKKWWTNALLFFKSRKNNKNQDAAADDVHHARAQAFRASISGPVYITESRSGSVTPCRFGGRSLSGNLTPARKGGIEIPYLSLRELNLEQQRQRISASAAAVLPIYIVT